MDKSVPNSDERLLAVLAKLEDCRATLAAGGNWDTAHLVSVAILDARMKLNRIRDAELRALCEEMALKKLSQGPRDLCPAAASCRRPLLRLVK